MKKFTFADRLVAGLKAKGWTQVQCGSRKYMEFVKRDEKGKEHRRFVGPSGALRAGECVSRSFSIGDPGNQTAVYRAYLAEGDAVLAAQSPVATEYE